MAKYVVTITETLEKQITVDADNGDEAIEKVRDRYRASKIILDADDFTNVVFGVDRPWD